MICVGFWIWRLMIQIQISSCCFCDIISDAVCMEMKGCFLEIMPNF
ncbi:hypothetical protein ZOSMA_56G01010 [Zostera marina]|uniref:Uncharacterized protein n=1 Tax=Zostera marina TaxID=29655 RepID=A0A0K9NY54_ZOSMR|nr:hypothetical protein ZOSMA_56G01010 [Zostera marina]